MCSWFPPPFEHGARHLKGGGNCINEDRGLIPREQEWAPKAGFDSPVHLIIWKSGMDHAMSFHSFLDSLISYLNKSGFLILFDRELTQ